MDKSVFRVLVVDTDYMLRQALIDYLDTCIDLKAAGGAKNGAEAIELCAKLKPDVILVDIQLPDMDGIQAIQEMRSHCPYAPVVVLTPSQMFKRRNDGIEAGAVTWLEKGVPLDQVIEALRLAVLNNVNTQSPD